MSLMIRNNLRHIAILIVDDHPLILSALCQLLPQLDRPVTVYGAADRDPDLD
jgi:DNA-binding NarL/FixJ family response regulator